MAETHRCPRRGEPGPWSDDGEDGWRDDQTCTFCGSLNPDVLMARIEAGDVELVPTDKSYKVYVRNAGGQAFTQAYRDCRSDPDRSCTGPDDCPHWTTREVEETKFYFQHLSADQRARFIELHNAGAMRIGFPGHFYRAPFFTRHPNPQGEEQDDG